MSDVGYLNISLITKSNKLLHYFYCTEQIGLQSLLKLTFRILGLMINSHKLGQSCICQLIPWTSLMSSLTLFVALKKANLTRKVSNACIIYFTNPSGEGKEKLVIEQTIWGVTMERHQPCKENPHAPSGLTKLQPKQVRSTAKTSFPLRQAFCAVLC